MVDSAGEVTAVGRMDGVGPINFDFAYACAYTAATTGRTGTELDWVKGTNRWRAASVMRVAGSWWPGARCRCATEAR